jgi:hypothetical protein
MKVVYDFSLFARSLAACAILLDFAAPVLAQNVELISVTLNGGVGTGVSQFPSMSSDGRFVAFRSSVPNLVILDTNGSGPNLFLRDRQAGTTELLSRSTAGIQYDGYNSAVSDDGRYAVFDSNDSIEASDTDTLTDVWLRDRLLGTAAQVSPNADGYQYGEPALSRDGRFVAFRLSKSISSGGALVLVSGFVVEDLIGAQDLRFEFQYDLGGPTKLQASWPRISGDGQWVEVAVTDAGSSPSRQVRRYSTATGQFNLVALAAGPGSLYVADAMSGDGRFSIYSDSFFEHLADHVLGTEEHFTFSYDDQPNGPALEGRISDDGRYAGFLSANPNLVWGGSIPNQSIYLRDRNLGTTHHVGLSEAGDPLDSMVDAWELTRTADGVLFATQASNVIVGDANGTSDVFFRKNCLVLWPDNDGDGFGAQTIGSLLCLPSATEVSNAADCNDANALIHPQGVEVCNGIDDNCNLQVDEGSAGVTYCLAKQDSQGCISNIQGFGFPSMSAPGNYSIGALDVAKNQNGIQFFGVSGAVQVPFQGGYLCVAPPLYRLSVKNTGAGGGCGGNLFYTLAEVLAQPEGGVLVVAGQTVYQQAWFRDPPALTTTGLSNALMYSPCP